MPPRKADVDKMNEIIRVRFKADELENIKDSAAIWNMTVSAYVRTLANGNTPKHPPVPVVDRQTYAELGRIGNNINQMARRMNQAQGIYPDQEEIMEAMKALRQEVNKIRIGLMRPM